MLHYAIRFHELEPCCGGVNQNNDHAIRSGKNKSWQQLLAPSPSPSDTAVACSNRIPASVQNYGSPEPLRRKGAGTRGALPAQALLSRELQLP